MRHEKIFKRKDGTRYKIEITLRVCCFQKEAKWDCNLYIRLRRQKSWSDLKTPEYNNAFYEHVTHEEVLETKMELWQLIKPE